MACVCWACWEGRGGCRLARHPALTERTSVPLGGRYLESAIDNTSWFLFWIVLFCGDVHPPREDASWTSTTAPPIDVLPPDSDPALLSGTRPRPRSPIQSTPTSHRAAVQSRAPPSD